MGKIYCIMGKSASGKDVIFKRLLKNESLKLKNIVSYTTRPIRKKELDGVEYHFVSEAEERKLEKEGRIIERRVYDTRLGRWAYFLVDDGQVDLSEGDYLIIGTLESFQSLENYYKKDNVIPIYIEVEDSVRLERALRREKKQPDPKYEEMCRRFLTDTADFSEEKLKAAGVLEENIFENHGDIMDTVERISGFIINHRKEVAYGNKN